MIFYAAQEDDIPDKMVMQVLPIQGTFIVVSTTAKLKMIIRVSTKIYMKMVIEKITYKYKGRGQILLCGFCP